MNQERLKWWLDILATFAVLGGLVFVGLEIRQNTSQLRADTSRSITESANLMNAGVYNDPTLADILLRGEEDLAALDPVERSRFAAYQFARLNLADYILDVESEGVSDLNFRFVDYIVSQYKKKPGLQQFARSIGPRWAGSKELYARLVGE